MLVAVNSIVGINVLCVLLQEADSVAEHDPQARAEVAAHAQQLGGVHEQELQEGAREVPQGSVQKPVILRVYSSD